MAQTNNNKIYYNDNGEDVADILKDMKEMAETTDIAIEEVKQNCNKKVVQFYEKNIIQDGEIELLKEENENLKFQIPQGETQLSENLVIEDCSTLEFKDLLIEGNSWQEIRSGKNLLCIPDQTKTENGITTKVKNGIFFMTGSTTGDTTVILDVVPFELRAGTYTMSNNSGGRYPYLILRKENNETISEITYADNGVKTFTLLEDAEVSKVVIYYSVGQTPKKLGLQIEAGSRATEFEPYGITPSPDYLSPIRNCGDNINILKLENLTNGYIDDSGNFSSVSNNILTDYIPIMPNRDYILNLKETVTSMGIACYDENKNYIDRISITTLSNNFSFNRSCYYVRVWISKDGATTMTREILEELEVKLEQGTIATKYSSFGYGNINFEVKNSLEMMSENYQVRSFTFPMKYKQVLHVGDYLTEGGIHHKRKTIIFDGTENWGMYGSSEKYIAFQFFWGENIVDNIGLCNYFIKNTGKVYGRTGEAIWITSNNGNGGVRICISKDNVTNVNEWKEYLSGQCTKGIPLTVEYELAEEIIEPYSEEQQAIYDKIKKTKGYKGIVYIDCLDGISCKFKAIYYKDLETILRNINTAIVALGGV